MLSFAEAAYRLKGSILKSARDRPKYVSFEFSSFLPNLNVSVCGIFADFLVLKLTFAT